jgi:hypothetical protein
MILSGAFATYGTSICSIHVIIKLSLIHAFSCVA